jgi:hypothetical protein
MRRWRWLALGTLWLCFLARGLFYSSVIPLWEGWDEYAHFAYVQQLALRHALPRQTDAVSEEIDNSLRLVPLPKALADGAAGLSTHDEWWKLSAEERQRRSERLRDLNAALAWVPAASGRRLYEAQQPPLAYTLLAPVYWLTQNQPLLVRVWTLRLFDVLIAAMCIPLAYAIVLQVLRSVKWALLAAALVASFPEFLLSASRVSNEPLASLLGGLVLLLTLRLLAKPAPRWWDAAVLGAALGLALLAKAYFLSLLPAVALVLPAHALLKRKPLWSVALQVFSVLAAACAIAGWWYYRTWLATGTLSGEQTHAAAQALGQGGLIGAAATISWWRVADGLIMTHAWCANWSFLMVRSWMYRVYAAAGTVILAAALWAIARRGKTPDSEEARRGALVASVFFAALMAALLYHSLIVFRVTHQAIGIGWYLYGMVAAEATLAAVGLRQLAIGRLGRLAAPAAVVGLTLLDFFGAHCYMLPYYAGMLRRSASGALRAFDLRTADGGTVERIFANLAVNKPAFIGAGALQWLWVACVLAAILTVVVVILVASPREEEPAGR